MNLSNYYAALTLALILVTSQSCYVFNCMNDKRSIETRSQRQCSTCASGKGQCVGETICCGPDFGCHIGQDVASECAKEDDLSTPCTVKGQKCGNAGNCVLQGVCCNAVSCKMDKSCQKPNSYNKGLIALMKALLKDDLRREKK